MDVDGAVEPILRTVMGGSSTHYGVQSGGCIDHTEISEWLKALES